jgi:hypothetical protein
MAAPLISVTIPAYRQPTLLRRAIDSVLAQSFTDWELVISDDEPIPGETWQVVAEFAARDYRIRGVRNQAQHGQVGNMNNAMLAARGEWIKLLHHDDALKPHCLEILARIVAQRGDVVAVSCADETVIDGVVKRPFRRRGRALLEELAPDHGLLAMYMLDEACWGRPTSQLVHRSLIEAGVVFEQPEGIVSMVDSWWNARVHVHGPILVYNEPLVEWHQGAHDSISSTLSFEQLTAEFLLFRRMILPLVPGRMAPPPLPTVEMMVLLVRAFTQLRHRQARAIKLLIAGVMAPQAYGLAIAWLLRRWAPRRFSTVQRTVVWK